MASLFAVPFGVAMALPALRLQGLYLALASMAFASMCEILFFPQPEILGFDGKPIRALNILGFDFSQPFSFLGIHFGQDVGTMLFIAAALGVVGVLVVLLHKSVFGRRLTALGDSPAASATLGINPIVTKLGVFVISAAICGFAGALLGVFQGTATVQDFQMLNGLAYLLLLVVGGVAVVSGAVLGGAFLTLFTWLPTVLPAWAWLTEVGKWQARLGPGLAGIGIGRQPSGIIPTVGEDLRAQNARKRARPRGRGPAPGAASRQRTAHPAHSGRRGAGTGRLARRLIRTTLPHGGRGTRVPLGRHPGSGPRSVARRPAPPGHRVPDSGAVRWRMLDGHRPRGRALRPGRRRARGAMIGRDVARTSPFPLAGESIIGMDPPDHTRMRRLVTGVRPKRVEQLRPRAHEMVDAFLDAAAAVDGPVDLIEALTQPLPIAMICELLGVPFADRDRGSTAGPTPS